MVKYILRRIKVNPYYRREGLFPKRVGGYIKKIYVPKKEGTIKRKIGPGKYGYWYNS